MSGHSSRHSRERGWAFRAATPDDAATVTRVVHAAYSPYVDRIDITPGPLLIDYAAAIARSTVVLADLAGEVAGVLVTTTTGDDFVIENVAVLPRHQGVGLGTALLTYAETQAAAAGHDSVRLYTHEKMTENLALYSRRGYTIYNREPLPEGGHLVHLRKQLIETRPGAP